MLPCPPPPLHQTPLGFAARLEIYFRLCFSPREAGQCAKIVEARKLFSRRYCSFRSVFTRSDSVGRITLQEARSPCQIGSQQAVLVGAAVAQCNANSRSANFVSSIAINGLGAILTCYRRLPAHYDLPTKIFIYFWTGKKRYRKRKGAATSAVVINEAPAP